MLTLMKVGMLSAACGFASYAVAKEVKKAETVAQAVVAESVVSLEAKLVDGKKTWIPTSVSAKPGKVTFKLHNSLSEPHGFVVQGVNKPIVIPAGQTVDESVDLKKGEYELKCHMHPAHVSSKLHVE